MRKPCNLILSDGSSYTGQLIGAPLITSGEMVFTTGMVGYSEALTDPSYFGQILVFTYPLIGNYGIPDLPKENSQAINCQSIVPPGFESLRVNAAAVIVSSDSPAAFHWNSYQSLHEWLGEQRVPGIVGLDTRHLVQLIRQTPNLLGRIEPAEAAGYRSHGDQLPPQTVRGFFDPGAHELLPSVSTNTPVVLGDGSVTIGVIDCGLKWNIIRQLLLHEVRVQLLPWDTDFDSVECDGWLISNGPGDPTRTGDLRRRIARLMDGQQPILGICLGHQLLSLAAGAVTERMPYGHRSHNQPVYQVGTRRGCITSQNHGYVVVDKSLPPDWEPWFRNANDHTSEGIRHVSKPFRSVQFHPEAAGGPRDTGWIITEFIQEVRQRCH